MSLESLYQQAVLEHNRSPKHWHSLPEATHAADGLNAVCGDHIRVYLSIDKETIEAISFSGEACAITTASASMMCEALCGQPLKEAKKMAERFDSLLSGDQPTSVDEERLGDLMALLTVRQFPGRAKSARLPWAAFAGALNGEKVVTTEPGTGS